MDINHLLQTLNSKPVTYGMNIVLEKFNHRHTKIIFSVRDHANNRCMQFEIVYKKDYKKMVLESLLYNEDERDCSISATKLLIWAKSFVPDLIQHIDLEDASHVYLQSDSKSVKLKLALIRKFFYGESWYEKFGFYAIHHEDRRMYNESFINLREIPFEKVSVFLWIFIRPFVNDASSLKLKTLSSLVHNLTEHYTALNTVIPHTHFSLKMLIASLSNELLNAIARHLIVYGYPKKYLQKDNTEIQENFFTQNIRLRDMKGTLYTNWYPYAKLFLKVSKNTEDDSVEFFETIQAIFYIFTRLGIIYVPWELRYPVIDTISGVKRSSE